MLASAKSNKTTSYPNSRTHLPRTECRVRAAEQKSSARYPDVLYDIITDKIGRYVVCVR